MDDDILSMLFLNQSDSFKGWFNSCRSWSAWFSRFEDGYIDLDVGQTESWMILRVYLGCVIVGATIPVTVACIIIYLCRDNFKLAHPASDIDQEEEFEEGSVVLD